MAASSSTTPLSSPAWLALLLDACGKTALERAGAILVEGVGE